MLTRVETEEISYERSGSCFPGLFSGGGGRRGGVGEANAIGYTVFGDCCCEFQMRKHGVNTKRRNSL